MNERITSMDVSTVSNRLVLVLEDNAANPNTSVPLGPDALGYLIETSRGYEFVSLSGTQPDAARAPDSGMWAGLQWEESCF
jgi:hypothetical protein